MLVRQHQAASIQALPAVFYSAALLFYAVSRKQKGAGLLSEIAKRFIVSGRVQGVFFRASTRKEAERLGLRGSAVNLPDGRVEVLAVGEPAVVDELGKWLEKGPTMARVQEVQSQLVYLQEFPDSFSCG